MSKTVYLTAYALSSGIETTAVRRSHEDGYVSLEDRSFSIYKIGHDVFETFEEAVADANARRDKKIKSLEKQISKLRALKFEEQQP
jgi:hypothetical protein